MKRYQLYVKIQNSWDWLCSIDSLTHAEAFHRTLTCLGDLHQDKPIRLEQDIEGAYYKPCCANGARQQLQTNEASPGILRE